MLLGERSPLRSSLDRKPTGDLVRALDAVDQKIVDLLRVDGRATLSTLGEALGVSRTTVQQRLQRLRADGSVRVVGLVDPTVRGRSYSLLLDITVRGDAASVADAVAALPETHLSVTTETEDLVLAQVALESGSAVRDFFNDKVRTIDGVVGIRSDLILSIFSTSVTGDGAARQWADSNAGGVELDAIDGVVVGELQRDGRASFASIARACGLSTPAARQRALRLIADDVVRIRTLVAPEILDLHAPAAFSVHLTGNSRAVVEAIAAVPGVTNVSEVVGANDVRGEMYCRDERDRARCVGAIESVPGVSMVVVHPYRYLANPGGAWSD